MSAVTPIQTSFNAGEITPRLDGRTDQNVRTIATKKMVGWVPLLQGPAEAAPGTLFVAAAKGPSRFIPFEFNETQGYVIEAGDLYLRFYTNDAQIESSPGTPYEIVSPWSYARVQEVDWDQSLDVLYVTHGEVEPQAVVRTGADSFSINEVVCRNGPWESRNSDESLTVAFSGTTGSVTVTASQPLFESGDVGGLMEIEFSDFSAVKSWEPGMEIAASALVQWGGRVYQHVGGNTRTGSVAPVHTEGDRWDGQNGQDVNSKGPYGCILRYLYDRWGQIRFTAYTDSQTMTATVERRLAATSASWRWRFGAFSDRRGWPSAVGIWQDRPCFAKDNKVHCGVLGDYGPNYANFALRNELGDASRDMAFTVVLPEASAIRWLNADRDLIVGTGKGEYVITSASAGAGAGPGNIDVVSPGSNGSANGKPVKVGPRVVYVQRSRSKLLQLGYDSGRLLQPESEDMTRNADHIGARGFRDPVWQKEPHRLLWLRCDDGTAAGCAYNPDEQLLGWFNRRFADGLSLKSHVSISDPDGRFDQMWFLVQSGEAWWVLLMAPFRSSVDTALDKVMSDASVVIDGAASNSVSAPHLAGKTVEIIADGRAHRNITLDGSGNGTIDFAAAKKIVGLPFEAEIELLSIEAGSDNGSAQNKLTRVHRLDISMLNSDGIEIEVQGRPEKIEQQQGDSPLDTAFPLYTGYKQIPTIGNWQREEKIKIRRYLPKPATVRAVILHMQKSGT